MNVAHTSTKRDSLLEMFLDQTAGEAYGNGRLVTRQEDEHTISLIAYGWNKLAEFDTEANTVTIFAGHSENISPTVTEYINDLSEMAKERESFSVNMLMDAAPNVSRPPAESIQFIENYKSFSGSDSSVESWATEKVNQAVISAAKNLF